MSQKTILFTPGYINEFGDTLYERVVYKGKQDEEDEDALIVIEPKSSDGHPKSVIKESVIVLEDNDTRVGSYTKVDYFHLMVSIGEDKILHQGVREKLESSSKAPEPSFRSHHGGSAKGSFAPRSRVRSQNLGFFRSQDGRGRDKNVGSAMDRHGQCSRPSEDPNYVGSAMNRLGQCLRPDPPPARDEKYMFYPPPARPPPQNVGFFPTSR